MFFSGELTKRCIQCHKQVYFFVLLDVTKVKAKEGEGNLTEKWKKNKLKLILIKKIYIDVEFKNTFKRVENPKLNDLLEHICFYLIIKLV